MFRERSSPLAFVELGGCSIYATSQSLGERKTVVGLYGSCCALAWRRRSAGATDSKAVVLLIVLPALGAVGW